jgi:hypothetical protein
MQSEKIFKGGHSSRDDDRSATSCLETSNDSSSSYERKRYNSRKRVTNVRNRNATPIGQIKLKSDAFRGAMNPENLVTSVIRGNYSRQDPGMKMRKLAELLPVIDMIQMMQLHTIKQITCNAKRSTARIERIASLSKSLEKLRNDHIGMTYTKNFQQRNQELIFKTKG